MDRLRTGCVGLGPRGAGLIKNVMMKDPLFDVRAVCDLMPGRIEDARAMFKAEGKPAPRGFSSYEDMLAQSDIDAVIISTAPENHIPMAIQAMEAGKIVGMEVGGAYNMDACFELVRAKEKHDGRFMMLENTCYGRRELMALNMARQGVFGEIVHCSAGYCHDIRPLAIQGEAPLLINNRFYRSRLTQNADRYPTHDLGPIARILGINRGDRIISLTSTASRAAGMSDYVARRADEISDPSALTARFSQGDIVTTVMKCASGATIVLTYDTCLPRYYCRGLTVRGTRGMYEEVTDSVFLDGVDTPHEGQEEWKAHWNNAKEYEEKYDHPLWKEYAAMGAFGGHGGMDGLTLHRFAQSALSGGEFDIDVYDAALWMSISILSEESINKGSAPVAVPDMTGGLWAVRRPAE